VVLAQGQGRRLHAFRQLEVGDVEDVRGGHVLHVDLDVLGDETRQALDFQFRQQVLDDATLDLHAVALLLVDEVQRHADLDHLLRVHAQEVRVHDAVLRRVALQVLENRRLDIAVDVDVDHLGEERLVFEGFFQVLADDRERRGILAGAVDDRRDLVRVATQAAARTFPQVAAQFGFDSQLFRHVCLLA
jgi:hypothetical protein